jgi:maltose O-acetyltransferase
MFFSSNLPIFASRSRIITPAIFKGRGKIIIQDDVRLGCAGCPNQLSSYIYIEARDKSSEVVIGRSVSIANNVYICADYTSIKICSGSCIGSNVQIFDSDFHVHDETGNINRSRLSHSKPVLIGKNVFIGNNVIILKGVIIGDNSTIGAGSVVTRNVPENSVFGGNPAKFIMNRT